VKENRAFRVKLCLSQPNLLGKAHDRALLQTIAPLFSQTTLNQMSQIMYAMLASNGRIIMSGLSRWSEKGGGYRMIQRFYHTRLPWPAYQWKYFQSRFLKPSDEYIAAGNERAVSKAGK
jgi:hypothetical protein